MLRPYIKFYTLKTRPNPYLKEQGDELVFTNRLKICALGRLHYVNAPYKFIIYYGFQKTNYNYGGLAMVEQRSTEYVLHYARA